jgi:hypothetical protein
MDDLKSAAQKTSDKLQEPEANPLWYPLRGPAPTDVVDPFKGELTKAAFLREQDAKDYTDAITEPKSFRIAQAAKLQSDTLAALERDTRMRHRTRCRMLAHATGKLITHGLDDGPIKRAVLFVTRLKEQAGG